MLRILSILCVGLLAACSNLTETPNYLKNEDSEITKNAQWKVGAKIHFEEVSGTDYLGLKEINKITKNALKVLLKIDDDSAADNAKILLKRKDDKLIMTYYEEKSRPGVGEELHATLLYTNPRGFHNSETLHHVCRALFENCSNPPGIEEVAKAYSYSIKQNLKFKISEIILTESDSGPVFIMAKLLLNGYENIYKDDKPISAGLHMTLVNCEDYSALSDSEVRKSLIEDLNKKLSGKMIQSAIKEGIADLEFGLSSQPWRIRAGKRIEFSAQ